MSAPRRHVLVVGADPATLSRIAPLLHRAEFDVHTTPFFEPVLDLVRGTAFELIVVSYPLRDLSVEELLQAVREDDSSCLRAGFLLLCHPPFLEEARRFFELGANRVVSADWEEPRLWQTFAELLEVAPRFSVRIPVHLVVRLQQDARILECQTDNISRSGMLLLGPHDLERGITFDFIFAMPGEVCPIRGSAELVRLTNPTREQLEGFGVRFLSFRDDDRSRLEQYLAARHGVPSPSKPDEPAP